MPEEKLVDIEFVAPQPNPRKEERIGLMEAEIATEDNPNVKAHLEAKLENIKNPHLKEDTLEETGKRTRAYGENLKAAYDLPPHLWWVGYYTSKHLNDLKEAEGNIFYHGTRLSHLSQITETGGMKAFAEKTTSKLAVFGTPDPTLAAFHAYYRGGGDTYMDDFPKNSIDPNDPVVLLEIDLRKISDLTEEKRVKLREKALETYQRMETAESSGRGSFYGEEIATFIPSDAIKIVEPDKSIGNVTKLPLEHSMSIAA